MTAQHNTPVYRYFFDHAIEEPGVWGPNYTMCEGYACHGVELPFVFGTASAFNVSMSADETVLCNAVMTFWGNFVNTGHPAGKTTPGLCCLPSLCCAVFSPSTRCRLARARVRR